jgi:hypothetical protein
MKRFSIIIAAAALSGAAYGGSPWFENFQAQMERQEQARQVHEQLEEIRAAQRQHDYCSELRYPDPVAEQAQQQQMRIQRLQERYLRALLEDCE